MKNISSIKNASTFQFAEEWRNEQNEKNVHLVIYSVLQQCAFPYAITLKTEYQFCHLDLC